MLQAPLKRSTLDKETNTQIIFLFIILVGLSFISAVANEILKNNGEEHGYIGLEVGVTVQYPVCACATSKEKKYFYYPYYLSCVTIFGGNQGYYPII